MKSLSYFQLVVLGIFGFFLMAGIVVVAVYSSAGVKNQTQMATVYVWGTFDQQMMDGILGKAATSLQNVRAVYIQKNEKTFDADLVEAIAEGIGPDAVIIPQDDIAPSLTKLSTLSYQYYPSRDYLDAFLQEGQLLLTDKAIIALPFAIDPLVMYWNRDIFSRAGLANPPQYWDEIFSLAQKLTTRDSSNTIVQSGVALGEYDNIDHAKDILSALFLQSGNSIATWNPQYTAPFVTLTQSQAQTPPESVLSFYTQFSDAQKPVYSWNRALVGSQSMFLSNRLGIYFGYGSEAANMRSKSPNLNFDVAQFPQSRAGSVPVTFGKLYAVAALKSLHDGNATLAVMKALTSATASTLFTQTTGWAPARKDVSVTPNDPNLAVFKQSVLIARAWVDPGPSVSDSIFRDMVESVTSGFSLPRDAVATAAQQLQYASPRQ